MHLSNLRGELAYVSLPIAFPLGSKFDLDNYGTRFLASSRTTSFAHLSFLFSLSHRTDPSLVIFTDSHDESDPRHDVPPAGHRETRPTWDLGERSTLCTRGRSLNAYCVPVADSVVKRKGGRVEEAADYVSANNHILTFMRFAPDAATRRELAWAWQQRRRHLNPSIRQSPTHTLALSHRRSRDSRAGLR